VQPELIAFEAGDDVGAGSAVVQADNLARQTYPRRAGGLARALPSSFAKHSRLQTLSARLMNHLPQMMQRCGTFAAK
jgi:hypothetical protein